jgi:YD repeat-containing protein
MKTPWRRLALAAALQVTVGVGVVAAQTIVVKNAPVGKTVEVTYDGARQATATTDARGDATLTVKIQTDPVGETDIRVGVDVCGDLRRVVIFHRLTLPPVPPAGCERRDIGGIFAFRSVSSLLVDVGGQRAAAWLRQGAMPREWLLRDDEVVEHPLYMKRPSPTGLVVFGSGALAKFADALTSACGNVTDCSSKTAAVTYSGGATVWITRWLGVEGGYTKPKTLKTHGNGASGNYHFDTSFDTRFATAVVKLGIPIGPVRPYAIAGMNYHESTTSTTETIDEKSVTVGDVTTTIPAATDSWTFKTKGWNLDFGGGIEVWLTRSVGLYAEISRAKMKVTGNDTGPGINDRSLFFVSGIRLKLGR